MSQSQADPTTTPSLPKQVLKRKKPFWARVMKVVSRTHLYTGLFMVPWVIVYAISGFTLNDGVPFSGRNEGAVQNNASPKRLSASEIAKTPLGLLPASDAAAKQVIASLNSREGESGKWALYDEITPKYRSDISLNFRDANKVQHLISVSMNDGQPTGVSRVIANPGNRNPAPNGFQQFDQLAPPALNLAQKQELRSELLSIAGVTPAQGGGAPEGMPLGADARLQAAGVTLPSVQFHALKDGRLMNVMENLATGSVNVSPVRPPGFSFWSYMERLHISGGFRRNQGAAYFIWSIVADVSAFLFVFWAVTGLVMWFQIKSTRWWGVNVLVYAALATALLGAAMWKHFLQPR